MRPGTIEVTDSGLLAAITAGVTGGGIDAVPRGTKDVWKSPCGLELSWE